MLIYRPVDIEAAQSKRSILTHTGQVLNLVNPQPDTFRIVDIGMGLSSLVRFAGQIKSRYTVAQHCAACVRGVLDNWQGDPEAPELLEALKAALLHEAGEAYLRDVPTPAKLMMPDYMAIESRLLQVAGLAFRTPLDPLPDIVKAVDSSLCGYEARHFHKTTAPEALLEMMFPQVLHLISPEVANIALAPDQAYDLFIRIFDVLWSHDPQAVHQLRTNFRWS